MGILYITIFVFITIITSFSLSQVYAEPIIYDDDYIVEKFVTGLDYPTTMIFVGEDILVLEKNTGKVIRIQDNGVIYSELALDVPVIQAGELGLLGIAFASNHVYLYFTESLSGFDKFEFRGEQASHLLSTENARNVVFQYDWNGEKLTNPILIKELPVLHANHAGGVITKGLNNEIYFVIGDQEQRTTFQNIHADATYETGGIFKIDTESNNSVELFAMGIRNSFGLAVDPITGYLWETENAAERFDEINLVKPGFNSGWISIMGPVDRVDSDLSTLNPKPFENFVYSDPEFSWYVQVAPTAIAFPDKDGFGKHSDSLFVGDFNNGIIYNFQLNLDRTGFVFSNPELSDLVLDDNDKIDEILFASISDKFRYFTYTKGVTDIEFHDGAMYVVAFVDGSIYKIYPKEPFSPLKQYQSGVPHKKIVCKQSLMPIISKTGYVYCVQPKTAITLINVLNWSIDHPEMPKIELKNQDLQGLDFEYLNLSNSDFRGANFDTATKISNANFTRANLSNADLSGKDITGTILTGADLSRTNLAGVDLSGKDLTGTRLVGVDLSGQDISDTILTGANLSNTILTGADLTNAVLTGAILTGADLENAVLTGAILNCVGHPICV